MKGHMQVGINIVTYLQDIKNIALAVSQEKEGRNCILKWRKSFHGITGSYDN